MIRIGHKIHEDKGRDTNIVVKLAGERSSVHDGFLRILEAVLVRVYSHRIGVALVYPLVSSL